MENRLFGLILILLPLLIISCSREEPEKPEILAGINDFNLTQEEFRSKLAAELEMEQELKLTRDARREFLESIIRKELLIQEATRLNLDKEERFIKAIERYWESTLIRDLMEMKGKEISRGLLVSEEEVRVYYNELQKEGEDVPPFPDLEESIVRKLKDKKKTRELQDWINGLKEKATITIDQELLYE